MFNSLAILKLSRAWAKPHQICRLAESATTANTRKHLESGFVRVTDETQPVLTGNAILEHHEYLIAIKSTQEKLMKARLGVTKQSKRLSTTFLRDLAEDKHDALKVAQNDLDRLVGIPICVVLLDSLESSKAPTFGSLEEFILLRCEIMLKLQHSSFFCKNGVVLSLENLNVALRPQSNLVEPLKIGHHDYLVGLAGLSERLLILADSLIEQGKLDFTVQLAGLSERLLILADSLIEQGKLDFTERICVVVNRICQDLSWITHNMYEIKMEIQSKMNTMIRHLVTVERACYDTRVRGPRRNSAACFEFRERGPEHSSAH